MHGGRLGLRTHTPRRVGEVVAAAWLLFVGVCLLGCAWEEPPPPLGFGPGDMDAGVGSDASAALTCMPLVDCGGACVDTQADPAHCGGCSAACASGEVCAAGSCSNECPSPLTECDGRCVDTDTSVTDCGGCSRSCGAGQRCDAGACVCDTGLSECDGACVACTCAGDLPMSAACGVTR